MKHIADTLGKKNYRYTGFKKYKERIHKNKCLKTQAKLAMQTLKFSEVYRAIEHTKVELKEFNDTIQKVYDTYQPEQQDKIIEKILKARLLLGK